MPRKGDRKPRPGDPNDPRGMRSMLARFEAWMRGASYSEDTIKSRREQLWPFLAWLEERDIRRANEITRPVVERYQRHLAHYRKETGEPLRVTTRHMRMTAVRVFLKYLARENLILYNPAADVVLPRLGRQLPRHVLSASEVEEILNQANTTDPLGVRDRAMMEVLYSTGLRRMELVRLRVEDLDSARGTLTVREGKGRKDRVVPIGERAIAWIEKYLEESRPSLAADSDEGNLFLVERGRPMSPVWLTDRVRGYVKRSGVGKAGACHLFRHTMATLMLEGGADIRFIQAMLGHEQLSSTQIYTRVSIRKLKEIHTATHPAARIGKKRHRDADTDDDVDDANGGDPNDGTSDANDASDGGELVDDAGNDDARSGDDRSDET